jgi:hypothetical protein
VSGFCHLGPPTWGGGPWGHFSMPRAWRVSFWRNRPPCAARAPSLGWMDPVLYKPYSRALPGVYRAPARLLAQSAILRLHKQRSCTRREEKWAPCNPTSEAQATKNAVALEPALAILIPSMAAAKNEGPAVQTILGAVQSPADAGSRLNLRHRPGAQAAVTASSALSSFLCTKA